MDHWAILLFMDVQPTYPPWPRIPLSNKGLIAGVNCLPNNLSCSITAAVSHQLGWVTYAHLGYAWWKTICPFGVLHLRLRELSWLLCIGSGALSWASLAAHSYCLNYPSTYNLTGNYTTTYFVRVIFVIVETFILSYAAHFNFGIDCSPGWKYHER